MHPKGEKFTGKWGGIDTVMAEMLLVNWLANSNLFVTKKERETRGEIKRGTFIIVLRGKFLRIQENTMTKGFASVNII